MAIYTSFDPRKSIRETIGTTWWNKEDGETWNISAVDNDGTTIRIPIYLAEEVKSESLKEMPFIDLNLALVNYITNNVQGDKRKIEAYIDVGFWYTNTDNVSVTSFGKKAMDELIDKTRANQCIFPGIDYATIVHIKLRREPLAHQVVFHYIVTIYCEYYDLT